MMVMVPALLGLKGNLEMTLASRLSTVSWKIKKKMTLDNLRISTSSCKIDKFGLDDNLACRHPTWGSWTAGAMPRP